MYSIVPDVKRIAVLRANALGDLIVSLPAFAALRAAYPGATITLFGQSWHQDFLTGRQSDIDEVIVVPPIPGLTVKEGSNVDFNKAKRFFLNMQKECFDIAIQLHGGGRFSNPFIKSLHSSLTVGTRAENAIPLDLYIPYVLPQPEIFKWLEVVGLIGAHPVTVVPHITVSARDRKELYQSLGPINLGKIAVIHPGASGKHRRWDASKFAKVGDALFSSGYTIYIIGVEAEEAVCDAVENAMHEPCSNICGKLTLCGLVALLSRASLVIANDSGPLHLANAVGTPTIGLYWMYNYANYGLPNRAITRPVVSWRRDCPSCGVDLAVSDENKNGCLHEVSLLEEVSVEKVIYEIGLLENTIEERRQQMSGFPEAGAETEKVSLDV